MDPSDQLKYKLDKDSIICIYECRLQNTEYLIRDSMGQIFSKHDAVQSGQVVDFYHMLQVSSCKEHFAILRVVNDNTIIKNNTLNH